MIAEDKEYDVGGAMIDDKKRIPLAVSFTKARTEWKVLDDSVKADLEALAKVRRGDFTVTSKTDDDKTWVVAYTTDDGPVAVLPLRSRRPRRPSSSSSTTRSWRRRSSRRWSRSSSRRRTG